MVLSAQKRPRLAFLDLPEDLQDEIVDGLDPGAITLQGASELVRTRGQKLSHARVAIALLPACLPGAKDTRIEAGHLAGRFQVRPTVAGEIRWGYAAILYRSFFFASR